MLISEQKQQGTIAIITLLVLFIVISILTLGLARILIMEERNGAESINREQAFMAAQAGLNYALGYAVQHTDLLLPGAVITQIELSTEMANINTNLKSSGNYGEITALKINYFELVDDTDVNGGAIYQLAASGQSADGQVVVSMCRKIVRTGPGTSVQGNSNGNSVEGAGGSGNDPTGGAVGIVGGSWRDYGCAI